MLCVCSRKRAAHTYLNPAWLTACLLAIPPHAQTVLLQGTTGDLSAEQLEQLGAALCARPVLSLFDSNAAVRAAIDAGDARAACADWELHGEHVCGST
jgi:hypothetical protein